MTKKLKLKKSVFKLQSVNISFNGCQTYIKLSDRITLDMWTIVISSYCRVFSHGFKSIQKQSDAAFWGTHIVYNMTVDLP